MFEKSSVSFFLNPEPAQCAKQSAETKFYFSNDIDYENKNKQNPNADMNRKAGPRCSQGARAP